ncbi:anion permease [Desulfotalea psychrophila]|uniref:Related to Na/dicarboxylate cotransporter n=1 Tax=Desulfotalea psychrophila (strain LSv54 / DSM 12343) TaxID=177439 RepID=Q6AQ76_DESPS|nr:anion permease [Desulfotalea psychrophila]CAG35497.1 related to Na/dicarboxylate cotransporter [Desulfotalea psychrophila LSv54]
MPLACLCLIIFLTELTSNTATAALVMPILSAVAVGLDQNPLSPVIPATITKSCALPVATPPNAIVFGSAYVTIPRMVKSGFGLDIVGLSLALAVTYLIAIPLFGLEIGVLPEWVLAAAPK